MTKYVGRPEPGAPTKDIHPNPGWCKRLNCHNLATKDRLCPKHRLQAKLRRVVRHK